MKETRQEDGINRTLPPTSMSGCMGLLPTVEHVGHELYSRVEAIQSTTHLHLEHRMA